ncbi:hypothetical protein BTL_4000 [Burkholderia thailandensis H0587]|nr:hypothetical protein BTL_4000 [Burkholderia thailandensis H0587]
MAAAADVARHPAAARKRMAFRLEEVDAAKRKRRPTAAAYRFRPAAAERRYARGSGLPAPSARSSNSTARPPGLSFFTLAQNGLLPAMSDIGTIGTL